MKQTKKQLGRDLIAAARENAPDLTYIAYLLAQGADVRQTDDMNATALYIAACFGHEDIVRMLLDAGADINHQSQTGSTPLAVAVQYDHADCVDVLINKGAFLDSQDNMGYTPLMWAAYKGHDHIARILVEAGADLSPVNKLGQNAIYLAWSADQEDIGDMLSRVADHRAQKAVEKKLAELAEKGFPSGQTIRIRKGRKPGM